MGFAFCFPTPTDTYKVSAEQIVLCSVTLTVKPYAQHSRVQRTLIAKIYPLQGSDTHSAAADNRKLPEEGWSSCFKQCKPQQGAGQRQLDVGVIDHFRKTGHVYRTLTLGTVWSSLQHIGRVERLLEAWKQGGTNSELFEPGV